MTRGSNEVPQQGPLLILNWREVDLLIPTIILHLLKEMLKGFLSWTDYVSLSKITRNI